MGTVAVDSMLEVISSVKAVGQTLEFLHVSSDWVLVMG